MENLINGKKSSEDVKIMILNFTPSIWIRKFYKTHVMIWWQILLFLSHYNWHFFTLCEQLFPTFNPSWKIFKIIFKRIFPKLCPTSYGFLLVILISLFDEYRFCKVILKPRAPFVFILIKINPTSQRFPLSIPFLEK